MRCSAKGFLCAFQQVFAVLVGARQVKDSKTVRCQDLEEAGCPPNPKELDRTGAGFALAVQHPCAGPLTYRPRDLITCTAPETRFPGEERPCSQVEGADVKYLCTEP